MAANWQCTDCGEIVYSCGEPDACMNCGGSTWDIYQESPETVDDETES